MPPSEEDLRRLFGLEDSPSSLRVLVSSMSASVECLFVSGQMEAGVPHRAPERGLLGDESEESTFLGDGSSDNWLPREIRREWDLRSRKLSELRRSNMSEEGRKSFMIGALEGCESFAVVSLSSLVYQGSLGNDPDRGRNRAIANRVTPSWGGGAVVGAHALSFVWGCRWTQGDMLYRYRDVRFRMRDSDCGTYDSDSECTPLKPVSVLQRPILCLYIYRSMSS